ncbi:MAG: class I SAM-dependent methyltransferase, partial [Kibdelosporangium sp.]
PYGQARAARSQPLLLHSMSVFREMFALVFAGREIRTVVEVGVESGQVSSIYTDLGAQTVYCVDPLPSKELRDTLAKNPKLKLVERPSPAVLDELPVADLYVLDGDHNYAIVHGELNWIMKNAPDAVIILHDVLWPCARRDQYYLPSALAPEEIHETSPSDGSTIWHDELTPAGFVGMGSFVTAKEAGGERNGVLTAVEDAVSEGGGDWLLEIVPAVFGMGIVVRKSAPGAKKIMAALAPFTSSKLLSMLENNRVAMYTRILQMQYEMVAAADNADQMAEEISTQRHEIDRLRAEVEHLKRELGRLGDENAHLRHLVPPEPERGVGPALALLARSAAAQVRKARN